MAKQHPLENWTRDQYRKDATQKLLRKLVHLKLRIDALLKDEGYSVATEDLVELGKLVVQQKLGLVVHSEKTQICVNEIRNPYIL